MAESGLRNLSGLFTGIRKSRAAAKCFCLLTGTMLPPADAAGKQEGPVMTLPMISCLCSGDAPDNSGLPGYPPAGSPENSLYGKGTGDMVRKEKNDSICIKTAETDEELCGRGYVHCTSWQEAYRGIVCDRYLDSMTVEATTARARQFPGNTLVAYDILSVKGKGVGKIPLLLLSA